MLLLSLSRRWKLLITVIIVSFASTSTALTSPSRLLRRAEAVRRWIRNVRHHNRRFLRLRRLVVGLGLGGERNDSFSTIHLSVGRNSLVIQLDHFLNRRRGGRVPGILTLFISDNRISFVGISNGAHARKLEISGLRITNLYDLKEFVGYENNEIASYNQIVRAAGINANYSGFDLKPEVTYSNWTKSALDDEQISQAAGDAYVKTRIGVKNLWEGM